MATDKRYMEEETEQALISFGPLILFHADNGEFAIHEAYFDAQDRVVTWTVNALSARAKSVDELRSILQKMLADSKPGEKLVSGDLQYEYDKEDLEEWLMAFDAPVMPFDTTDS